MGSSKPVLNFLLLKTSRLKFPVPRSKKPLPFLFGAGVFEQMCYVRARDDLAS